MKIRGLLICSAITIALLLSSCKTGDNSIRRKETNSSNKETITTTSSGQLSSENNESQFKNKTTTTTVTTKATTTTTRKPIKISEELLYNNLISLSNFSKVYSNEELEECLDRLDEISKKFGNSLAFSYENIDTGAQVNYNSNQKFMTCSTIKAPYIKSILEMGIDLDSKLTKNKNWPWDIVGEDVVASMKMGTEFTTKELIEYSIEVSDNTSYYMLEQHYGWSVFNNLNNKIGANYYVGPDWIFTYCTSQDMLRSYKDIYHFGEKNKDGAWLIDLMTKTHLNEQISKNLSKKYKVAHKYGSEFNENVYNDCAIVYANSPFVLSIFSNQRPETKESNKVFIELAEIFDEINSLIYIQK